MLRLAEESGYDLSGTFFPDAYCLVIPLDVTRAPARTGQSRGPLSCQLLAGMAQHKEYPKACKLTCTLLWIRAEIPSPFEVESIAWIVVSKEYSP